LCGWSVDDADICCGAKDQLASLDEKVLLLLDNCDDPKTNFSRYIPNSPQVSVVLTTRLSDAGKYASHDLQNLNEKHFLRLTGLDEDSAVTLVLKASEVQKRDFESIQQARHIADVLDHHPLALVVASSLIQNTTYSLGEYAKALETRFTQSELLNTESEQATYRKVSATFEVSAETLMNLAKTDSSAHNALALLDILGFFHHQGVSEDIFVRAWDYAEHVSLHSQDEDWPSARLTAWHVAQSQYLAFHGTPEEKKWGLRTCRAHLIKLSLVSIDATGCVVSLHPLVQTWARVRLHRPVEAWTAAASILSLSTDGYLAWRSFTPSLVKDMESCFVFRPSSSMMIQPSLETCRIWYVFAWQMYLELSPGATELCRRIVEELSGSREGEYLLLRSQHLLGTLCSVNRQIPQAIQILEHVVKVREKLADDHPDRLASQHALAGAYEADGQISRAIEILEHVVKVREKLGDDHPHRLGSQHELAYAYKADGQISRAIEILEHVVNVEEKLADDHPDRLASQHALAGAYEADGQISRAIEILEHVVKVREKLADDHPDRLASQHELAGAYKADGQISRAMEILEHVVKVREKLGDDHPDRLASQHELAGAYKADGQISRAIEILEHVVKMNEKLVDDHPNRLASQHELARTYKADGQISRAIEILEHVVKVKGKLAEDHPSRLTSQSNLAAAYWDSGRKTEAECLFRQVAIQQRCLRADHPHRLRLEKWITFIENTRASEPSPDVSAGAERL
jgi:tetratricopeptide (TPR) repeat protein